MNNLQVILQDTSTMDLHDAKVAVRKLFDATARTCAKFEYQGSQYKIEILGTTIDIEKRYDAWDEYSSSYFDSVSEEQELELCQWLLNESQEQ